MSKSLPAALFALTLSLAAPAALAGVLVTQQWIMPTAPITPKGGLQIAISGAVDPAKPIWVVYQLLALSADDKPSGMIALDGLVEGVNTPIMESRVVFSADKLGKAKSAGTIGEKLSAQIGPRSPQELKELMGAELYEAFNALNQKRGAILQGTVVKNLPPPGKSDSRLLVSLERVTGMQPAQIVVTVGQGDIPAGLATKSSSGLAERVVIALVAFGAAAFWWIRRRR